ncbi:carbohydrate ABC transporter permease [Paenibacillus spongiae]|uniref:Carbohydrate ABC transporter permease n=1 Tax=Paenibacillus spongiae TaxID=2909671 RepID=A0ABY5S8I2_9BACL|nr:carbohydrate ABC transporter permease [Paenibacillus spongiae]UVI30227.1 carbohydrate ABC transporter permease [Paenibacillus spongiae]
MTPAKMQQQTELMYRTNRVRTKSAAWLWSLFRYVIIIGISFIIIYPILLKISVAIMDKQDIYNPTIFLVPQHFTWDNIKMAAEVLNFFPALGTTLLYVVLTMLLQAASCAMAGYGFARFSFPGSNVLFMLVILTILIPTSTLMVPMYLHFRNFDIMGIIHLFTGKDGVNTINTLTPSIITSMTANGLKSGLYIYIFRQFFKGLPKEIEEAALIDGAGGFKTFFRIMLPNATAPLITVMLFAFVWQYNDTFYTSLFMGEAELLSNKIASLPAHASAYINNALMIASPGAEPDPNHVAMVVDTGILLAILPLIVLYLFVQRYFVESVERSGVVG